MSRRKGEITARMIERDLSSHRGAAASVRRLSSQVG